MLTLLIDSTKITRNTEGGKKKAMNCQKQGMNCQDIKKRARHIRRPRHVTNPFRQKRKNVIGISRMASNSRARYSICFIRFDFIKKIFAKFAANLEINLWQAVF